MVGEGRNVPAGTAMTGYGGGTPDSFHFHLCSHAGIGTVNPTFYQVLHDDNDLELDNVVKMTNALTLDSKRCEKRYVLVSYFLKIIRQNLQFYLVSPNRLQSVLPAFAQNEHTITGKVHLSVSRINCVQVMPSRVKKVMWLKSIPEANSKKETFSSKFTSVLPQNLSFFDFLLTVAKQGLPVRLCTLLNFYFVYFLSIYQGQFFLYRPSVPKRPTACW